MRTVEKIDTSSTHQLVDKVGLVHINISVFTDLTKNLYADKILLRKRALIETVNDELKNIAQIEHSRHRSFSNFIANSLSAIAAYCFFEKKPAIDVKFVNDGQLAIF